MKKITLKLCMVIIFTLSLGKISAQVKTKIFPNGIPENISVNKYSFKEIMVTAPPNFDKLKQKDNDTEISAEYKNKFAETINVNYDLLKSANEFKNEENIVYSIKFSVEKALNLSFQFGDFKLSPNAVLSIYTNFELTDSITAKENNKGNIWATRIYQGSELYFKLSVPRSEVAEVTLRINKISLGYRHVGSSFFGNPGNSGNCNINVVCPPGTGWENERNSVALIVSGGNEICTGTLVMNTCGTNKPYLPLLAQVFHLSGSLDAN